MNIEKRCNGFENRQTAAIVDALDSEADWQEYALNICKSEQDEVIAETLLIRLCSDHQHEIYEMKPHVWEGKFDSHGVNWDEIRKHYAEAN